MRRSPQPEVRRLAACLMIVAALIAGACSKKDDPGVAVKTIASDIVFNAKAVEQALPTLALPPPSSGIFNDLGSGDEEDTTETTEPETTVKPRPVSTSTTLPPKPVCAEALATAFPRDAATFGAPKPPKVGEYRWKRTVSTPIPGAKDPSVQTAFNKHRISNVSKVTETPNPATPDQPTRTYTFDDEAFFVNGSIITTYQVKDNAPQQTVAVQTGQKATAGTADRGVSITKTVVHDLSGKQVGFPFMPNPPVLILPLPVAVPTDFSSVGVDPTSGASYAVQGTVVGKERVDACGDVVDGWKVKATQTVTSAGGQQQASDVEYYVASQLGGMMIYLKNIPNPTVSGPNAPTVTDNLAQLDPSPIAG